MTKQQYIDRFVGKTIDECADFCHEHDVHVRKERIEPLQKENAELRECLKEACKEYLEGVCKPSDTWFHGHLKDCATCYSKHCITKKWRAALEGGNHAND